MSSSSSFSALSSSSCYSSIGSSRQTYKASDIVFGKDIGSHISIFSPELIRTNRSIERAHDHEFYQQKLKLFSDKIGLSKYYEIASKAIFDIKKKPTFHHTTVSYRLRTKRIFCDLFNTIKKLDGESFLRALFPKNDLSSLSNVIDYCIYPEILEQMHFWIEDTNLIKMTSRINEVDTNLRTPLTTNSFQAVHERAQAIRTWLQNNRDLLQTYQYLNLEELDLTSIPEEIKLFTNLKFLNLSHNNIAQISATAFSTLVHLQKLYLEYNQIAQISAAGFSTLIRLEILDLKYNQIMQIPSTAFSTLARLKELDLSNNQIGQIPAYTFASLVLLEKFDLSHNRIGQIPVTAFTTLVLLEKLDLSHNEIEQIPSTVFSTLARLKELDLRYNQIRQISATIFASLVLLEELDLENNQIAQISATAFATLVRLRKLNLENKQIAQIIAQFPAIAFASLVNQLEVTLVRTWMPDNIIVQTSVAALSAVLRLVELGTQVEYIREQTPFTAFSLPSSASASMSSSSSATSNVQRSIPAPLS